MDVEGAGSPALSVGGPLSVPSRISVVLALLVEEANSGDTPRLGCPREDNDIWLLAGGAKPASMTVCEDDLGSPCVWGDAVLLRHCRGISFPVGPVDSPALSVGGASVGSLTDFGGAGRGGQS